MPILKISFRALVVAAIVVLCGAAPPYPKVKSQLQNAKFDAAVQAAVDSGQTIPVIVLGHSQLLERIHGLHEFETLHANDDRRRLRTRIISQLKQIARTEQSAILKALGKQSAEQQIWIANAMVLTLTPSEMLRAAALEEVEFLYPSREPFAVAESIGKLSLVLPRNTQKPFSIAGKRVPWNVEKLGAARVWNELGHRGEGVTVAILDGGANYGHPDLRDNTWRNAREIPCNGIDDDHNGYVDDYYGYDFANMRAEVRDTTPNLQHGTWTSGIVAGDGTDGIATGIAPRARLMQLIARGVVTNGMAFQYALENGADVMSMSFSISGIGNLRGLWRMMSDHAVAAGMFLVGGAGNFQTSAQIPTQVQTPKDIPSVMAIGGVDSTLTLVNFSSLGPVEWGTVALYGDYAMPNGLMKPELVAFPGADYPVLAAANTGYVDPNPRIRGNSFSGPQGAGVAALVMSAAPGLSAWRVREIMEQTATDLEGAGRDNRTGFGLINAYAAVRAAKQGARAGGTTPASTTSNAQPDAATARREINEAYKVWSDARVRLDKSVFEQSLSSDFYAQIGSQRMTRAQFIEEISRPNPAKMRRFETRIMTVQPNGSNWSVVITEKLEYDYKDPNGKQQIAYSLWMTRDGWKRTNDRWVATSIESLGNEGWGGGKTPPLSDWGNSESGDVLSTVSGLYDAMRTRDTLTLRSLLHSSMRLATAASRNGVNSVQTLTADQLVSVVGSAQGAAWNQKLVNPTFNVDGTMANVWSAYEFRRGDAFDHCGAVSIALAKDAERWKVVQLSDTHRVDGCNN